MNKNIYLGFAVAGLVLPYTQFLGFLLEHGLDTSLVIQQIVVVRLSAFAWLDVLVTAVVVLVIIWEERDEITSWWLPVVATLLVGPSCGLPLYLYLRE
jgi:hypothetical protein